MTSNGFDHMGNIWLQTSFAKVEIDVYDTDNNPPVFLPCDQSATTYCVPPLYHATVEPGKMEVCCCVLKLCLFLTNILQFVIIIFHVKAVFPKFQHNRS